MQQTDPNLLIVHHVMFILSVKEETTWSVIVLVICQVKALGSCNNISHSNWLYFFKASPFLLN